MNTKQWRGWTLPEGETHQIAWMEQRGDIRHGRPTYQAHKYDAALKLCSSRRVAVDVGGNIGTWSWLMAFDFAVVEAFEPVADFAACWADNVTDCWRYAPDATASANRAHLHNVALGEKPGVATMVCRTPGSYGDTTVFVGQAGELVGNAVEVRTLDSFGLQDVDLIKLDCEGYELFALRGARETLQRCRPVVIVEQKPGHGATFGVSDTAAVDYLQELGYRVREVIHGDYLMTAA